MYDIRCARCLHKCYIWGEIIQSVQYTSLINLNTTLINKGVLNCKKGQNTCYNVLYYETMEIWCVNWIFSRKNHCNRNANIFTKALLYSKDSILRQKVGLNVLTGHIWGKCLKIYNATICEEGQRWNAGFWNVLTTNCTHTKVAVYFLLCIVLNMKKSEGNGIFT